ncbi:MAG: AbrB family transcriptional regulator [Alphaproteobacteria bacterium]|nr:AbrB family transcriptional regulator [Alphaproteobacteria bacterium]
MERWGRTAAGLALGATGGALFVVLGLPLPWLLGAMLTVTAATLVGLPIEIAPNLRLAMLVVIGVLIGSAFDRAMLADMPRWLWSLAALPLYVVVVAGLMMTYLRRRAGFDRTTAYFAAAPGGLSEMILMSEQRGADVRRVGLVHTLRLLLLVTAIPVVVDQLGLVAPSPPSPPAPDLVDVALLAAAGVVGALGARLVRLPSAVLLGPMIASAAIHVAGWSAAEPPDAVVAFAQIVVGAAVGTRFTGMGVGEVVATLGHGAVMTTLMVALGAGFALVIHPLAGLALLPLLIAYVPGGVAEMALVALALGIDPAFVTTHHAVRIALVVGLASVLFARVVPADER